jgi:hypothetical protein
VGHEYTYTVLCTLMLSRLGKVQFDNRTKVKGMEAENDDQLLVVKKRPKLVKVDKGMTAGTRNKQFSQCLYVCQ